MSSTQSTLLCHYRYDPLDRLIHHSQVNAPTQQRFYCKSRLATEIQGTMQHSIVQHGDLLLAQQQRLGDKVSTTLLSTDLQRSVLHTLEKNHQQQAIAYSPYGHRRAESSFTSLLCFNGERPDPALGGYLLGNGYRAFKPVLMRFSSPDNLSPFGKGGINAYAYCIGDPINHSDDSGHMPKLLKRLLSKFKSHKPVKNNRLHFDLISDVRYELKYGHRIHRGPTGRRLSDPGIQTDQSINLDFGGYHGTDEDSAVNLLKMGVDPKKSRQGNDQGLYFSSDIKVAKYHSEHQNFLKGSPRNTPHIVEVHIQNFTGMKPGIDYDFRKWGENNIEIIARNHISRAITIRQLGSTPKAKIVSPRNFEAPF